MRAKHWVVTWGSGMDDTCSVHHLDCHFSADLDFGQTVHTLHETCDTHEAICPSTSPTRPEGTR